MEYFRDSKNRIQADIAYRLGKIASQYRTFPEPYEQKFSVTLDVCILQNLLTTCSELLKGMIRNGKKHYLTADLSEKPLWGLRQEIIESTFRDEPLSGEIVLKRMRNAVSHPTDLDVSSPFPSSGYTTIPNGSKKICQYCFVNSPDTKYNRLKRFDTEELAKRGLQKAECDGDMPTDVGIIKNEDGKFCFSRNGKPFARIFKITLTVEEIHTLVIELSNYLAQAIRENWDGVTIERLVA